MWCVCVEGSVLMRDLEMYVGCECVCVCGGECADERCGNVCGVSVCR